MNKSATTSFCLGIGGMVLGTEMSTITTVLGSCVAITMYEPNRKIGAICHAALPKCTSAQKCCSGCAQAGKHVNCAVRVMLRQFDKMHISKEDIHIKIFGGANMFSQNSTKGAVIPIGLLNTKAARLGLHQAGLEIMAADTGGNRSRKIIFNLATGKVVVQKSKNQSLVR